MKNKKNLTLPSKIAIIIFTGVLTAIALIILVDKAAAIELTYPIYTFTDDLKRKFAKNNEEHADLEINILNREIQYLKFLESQGSGTSETLERIQKQLAKIEHMMDLISNNEELAQDYNSTIKLLQDEFDKQGGINLNKIIYPIETLEILKTNNNLKQKSSEVETQSTNDSKNETNLHSKSTSKGNTPSFPQNANPKSNKNTKSK